jgi:hypothetical protein
VAVRIEVVVLVDSEVAGLRLVTLTAVVLIMSDSAGRLTGPLASLTD